MENGKGKIYAALAKAQAEFPRIEHNCSVSVQLKSGGYYTFTYADLTKIIEKTRPALVRNELACFQRTIISPDGKNETLITTLGHSSGEIIESSKTLPICINPQDHGSAMTYYRRYQYSAITGISSEEDTDDNHSSQSKAQTFTKGPAKNVPPAAQNSAPVQTPRPAQGNAPTQPQIDLITRMHKELKLVRKMPATAALASAEIEELQNFMRLQKKPPIVSIREEQQFTTRDIAF